MFNVHVLENTWLAITINPRVSRTRQLNVFKYPFKSELENLNFLYKHGQLRTNKVVLAMVILLPKRCYRSAIYFYIEYKLQTASEEKTNRT